MKVVFKWFIRVNVLPYAPISSSSFAFTDFATQVGTRPLEGVFGSDIYVYINIPTQCLK